MPLFSTNVNTTSASIFSLLVTTTYTNNSSTLSLPITNAYATIIRSKQGIYKPKPLLSIVLDLNFTELLTVKQAMAYEVWMKSMQSYFNAIVMNNTWVLVPAPKDRRVVGSKWVWRVKKLPFGVIDKWKSRVVTKGFDQTPSFDFSETLNPIMKQIKIRIIITMALSKW